MKKGGIVLVVAILIILALIGVWFFMNPIQNIPAALEPISLGFQPSEGAALIYVAEDQHFFSENGLNVTTKDYEPAAAGVTGMVNGEVDLAGASEYPIVLNILDGKNISILGTDVESMDVYLIGRKDQGIENISDLNGKKIGLAFGTISEFYLSRFLTLHDMNLQNVTVVNIDPSEFVDAIASGKVDAVVCAQPFAGEITEKLDNEVVEWSVQSSQPAYGVFVARNDWIAANSDLVVRFLKSINMAEQYTTTNPAGAKDIVQKQLNLSDPYLSSEWSENQFSLSLDQSLVLSMEDEARWMIANNMTNATTIPDFGKYIYTNGLENVSPDSVNIIQ